MFKYCTLKKNKLSCNYNKGDLLMKKIALILTILLSTSLASNAFVDNMYMTSEQYLVNTGYSAEMAKMINVTNQDPYREQYVEDNSFGTKLKRAYSYIAPANYTNMDYYNHSINFNGPNWKDF